MGIFKNKYRIDSARLAGYDYSNPAWYYVTICTKGMREWFGEVEENKMILNDCGEIVKEEWLKTKEIREKVDLDYFVIMPNHLHGIVIIEGPEVVETHRDASQIQTERRRITDPSLRIVRNNLAHIIKGFKGSCTKSIRKSGHTTFKWQPRFYDHIIRNEKDLYRIRKYIDENPLKWQLGEDEEFE